MFIIEFDAVAFVLLVITLYVFYSQKKVRDRSSSRFEILLWVSLGSAFFDFLSAAAINDAGKFGITLGYGLNMVFYLFHSAIPMVVASYVMAISGKTFKSAIERWTFRLPYVTVLLLISTNPWHRWIFYFDGDSRYRHGPGLAAPYLMVFVYIAYCLYLFRTRQSATSKLARYALPGLFVIPALAILLQNVFAGMLLECFAIAISMLLVLFTIQNSSELIDRECGLFNRAAFVKFAGMRLENRVGFDLILLCVQNEPLLRHIYPMSRLTELHAAVAGYLSDRTDRSGSAFYLEDGCFALLIGDAVSPEGRLSAAQEINAHFSQARAKPEPGEDIQVRACRLRYPDDVAGLPDIFDCVDQIRSLRFPGRDSAILGIGDLDLVNRKRQAEIERVMGAALEARNLSVLYQPIFSVSERRFAFADAQIVLDDENGGTIQQRELFRVAEHHGIMQRLGILALESVCSFLSAAELPGKGIRHVQLRLSGVQCMQSDLPQQILATLASHHVDPRNICFQITETAAVNAPDIMNTNMKALSGQNATFALDDYGSGYTDLDYIMDLPFSLIKIDKSIIQAGFATGEGRAAMESTVALIKRLNRNIVAEGVETREQAAFLTQLGCDFLQGYYFSRPLNETDFLKLVSAAENG